MSTMLYPLPVIVKYDSVLAATGRARYGAYVSHVIMPGKTETACGRFSEREVTPIFDAIGPDDGAAAAECRACLKVLILERAKLEGQP